ncbi:hypothetical protein SAMN05444287_2241 [Octadecabacter temperatus]|uniref:Uncharacterized protein n=1 Tax=Octadecabacter temperatus TaxID=1458307 RepID=A0A0K0Y1M3_9RHOB|nr:hypothetical protein OSB_02750 [Octadecabacter temperatus]SIO34621.1 hypothetical protein SAMN05444287_2241 [Octadecabacter temperatus]
MSIFLREPIFYAVIATVLYVLYSGASAALMITPLVAVIAYGVSWVLIKGLK